MKKAGKYLMWILGTVLWLFILMFFFVIDTQIGNNTHQLILIITGILLAIYLLRGKRSGTSVLEKENEELRAENQKLRQELEAQKVVTDVIAKTENREGR